MNWNVSNRLLLFFCFVSFLVFGCHFDKITLLQTRFEFKFEFSSSIFSFSSFLLKTIKHNDFALHPRALLPIIVNYTLLWSIIQIKTIKHTSLAFFITFDSYVYSIVRGTQGNVYNTQTILSSDRQTNLHLRPLPNNSFLWFFFFYSFSILFL